MSHARCAPSSVRVAATLLLAVVGAAGCDQSERCEDDDDCAANEHCVAGYCLDGPPPVQAPPPFDTPHTCVCDGACVPIGDVGVLCVSDGACVAQESGLFEPCEIDADCLDGEACLFDPTPGVGVCVPLAPCAAPLVEATFVGETATINGCAVVGADRSQCDAGVCRVPCGADADCAGDPRGAVCDVVDGVCTCVVDDDCAAPGVDRCYDGFCGCGGQAACSALGEYTCEEIPGAPGVGGGG